MAAAEVAYGTGINATELAQLEVADLLDDKHTLFHRVWDPPVCSAQIDHFGKLIQPLTPIKT
jgi:hypothetical protein